MHGGGSSGRLSAQRLHKDAAEVTAEVSLHWERGAPGGSFRTDTKKAREAAREKGRPKAFFDLPDGRIFPFSGGNVHGSDGMNPRFNLVHGLVDSFLNLLVLGMVQQPGQGGDAAVSGGFSHGFDCGDLNVLVVKGYKLDENIVAFVAVNGSAGFCRGQKYIGLFLGD